MLPELQRTLNAVKPAIRRYRPASSRPATVAPPLNHTWLSPHCTRTFASKSHENKGQETEDFLSPKHSTWDSVFADLPQMSRPNPLGRHPRPGQRPRRRQAMTAREISAFDEMFDMIFDAVSEKQHKTDATEVAIGRRGADEIFGKLRLDSKKLKFTNESSEDLDRKLEAMELCDTDQQLLEWAMREVFGESERLEAESRKAIDDGGDSQVPARNDLPMLQSPAYPHLVARLMRNFREKYADPHLALSIFDYAKNLSMASYVFGCGTLAYNELLETRWKCFRDLRGVVEAMEEMKVNGVVPNSQTRQIVERIRAEVGSRSLFLDDDVPAAEIAGILHRIEKLASYGAKDWKGKADHLGGDEGFGDWENVQKDRAKNRREVWLIAGYGTPLRANATARPIPLTASHCTGSEHTSRVVRPRTTPTTTGSSIPALALVRLCPSVGTVGNMREAAMQRAYLEFDECEQDGVGAERS
uniref:Mtf2-like C-terminal domain-containing protein n=1 Tax=Schizophyllum commune (strain H4-8 / FGSC 9210) TaxID=578458 RepID=D8QBU5_SCHCM